MVGFAVFFVVALVACFYLGSRYGRDAEAKAIAYELKFEAAFKSDYAALVQTIKTKVNLGFQRIKKFL